MIVVMNRTNWYHSGNSIESDFVRIALQVVPNCIKKQISTQNSVNPLDWIQNGRLYITSEASCNVWYLLAPIATETFAKCKKCIGFNCDQFWYHVLCKSIVQKS